MIRKNYFFDYWEFRDVYYYNFTGFWWFLPIFGIFNSIVVFIAIIVSILLLFCENAGYQSRLVEKGFLPKTEEERLYISPPEHNLDFNSQTSSNNNQESYSHESDSKSNSNDLDNIRKQLENLLWNQISILLILINYLTCYPNNLNY